MKLRKGPLTHKNDYLGDTRLNGAALAQISNAIDEIQYGSIQVYIQDGRVVQIDKVIKARLDK